MYINMVFVQGPNFNLNEIAGIPFQHIEVQGPKKVFVPLFLKFVIFHAIIFLNYFDKNCTNIPTHTPTIEAVEFRTAHQDMDF